MAHRLVDVPEVVQVEHQEPEAIVRPRRLLQPAAERARVEEAGDLVGLGLDLLDPERGRVAERDRDLAREQLDQLEVVLVESILGPEAFHRDHAQRAVRTSERDADEAPFQRSGRRELAHPGVSQLVADQLRLAMGEHPCREPSLAGLRRLEVGGRVHAPGEDRPERPGLRVQQLDRHRVQPDKGAEPVGHLLQDRPRVERSEDRLGDRQQRPLAGQPPLKLRGLGPQALGGLGVRHCLGGQAGVDDEEAQVVVRELLQAQLREHDHAEDLVLVDQGREQHRFIQVVVRAGDRLGSGVMRGVPQVLGQLVQGDPAGDSLADPSAEQVRRLILELADEPTHGHGDEPAALAQPIDTDVVERDQRLELVRDGVSDLLLGGETGELRAELLDRLQLRRPGGHPREVLGVLDGRRRVRRERRQGLELPWAPWMGSVVVDGQKTEQAVAVEERRGAEGVEALLDHRGSNRLRPRVVAIAHRKERKQLRRRLGGQRWHQKVPHRREIRSREPAAHLRGDPAVGSAK